VALAGHSNFGYTDPCQAIGHKTDNGFRFLSIIPFDATAAPICVLVWIYSHFRSVAGGGCESFLFAASCGVEIKTYAPPWQFRLLRSQVQTHTGPQHICHVSFARTKSAVGRSGSIKARDRWAQGLYPQQPCWRRFFLIASNGQPCRRAGGAGAVRTMNQEEHTNYSHKAT